MSFESGSHDNTPLAPRPQSAVTTPAAPPPPPDLFEAQARGAQENEGVRLFLRLIGLVHKHWILVVVICGLFGFAGLVVTFLMPKVYTASASLQIDREAAKVLRNLEQPTERMGGDLQFYVTQYELLKSRALAERVVSALSLADDAEFIAPQKSFFARFFGGGTGGGADTPEARQARAVGLVQAGTVIQPVPGSRIVWVGFKAATPTLAQKIANGIAENFLSMTLERRFNASAYTRAFLEEKLQQVKLKLEESERQVVAYAQKEGIVNVDDKASVAGANLKSLNDALAVATAERIRKEQVWLQAQAGNVGSLPQALDDKLIEKAREKRGE